MCKYINSHIVLCVTAAAAAAPPPIADTWFVWCANVPYCRWQGVFSAHIYIVFSIYQSVFHCPSIMPLLPLCAVDILTNAFSQCSMSSVWAHSHFFVIPSLLWIGVEGGGGLGVWSGWFSVIAKALCLKSYRERCARNNRLHKAFNLLSSSNCMSANILWFVFGLRELCPCFCLLFFLSLRLCLCVVVGSNERQRRILMR